MVQLANRSHHWSFTGAICASTLLVHLYAANADAETPRDLSISITRMGSVCSGALAPLPTEIDVKDFQALADKWRQDTLDLSSLTEMVAHPAYLQIISMGGKAVPLLLAELRREPDHWFVALEVIAKFNPVAPTDAGNLKKMTAAWLAWADTQVS